MTAQQRSASRRTATAIAYLSEHAHEAARERAQLLTISSCDENCAEAQRCQRALAEERSQTLSEAKDAHLVTLRVKLCCVFLRVTLRNFLTRCVASLCIALRASLARVL